VRCAAAFVSEQFEDSTTEIRTGTLSHEEDCHLTDTVQIQVTVTYQSYILVTG